MNAILEATKDVAPPELIVTTTVGGSLLVYMIPTIIALVTKHKHAATIVLMNILLGWTVVGWIAALIWSLIRPQAFGDE